MCGEGVLRQCVEKIYEGVLRVCGMGVLRGCVVRAFYEGISINCLIEGVKTTYYSRHSFGLKQSYAVPPLSQISS